MKPGSILYVRTEGFIPDAIRKYMKRWGKITGRKYSLPWNHMETIIRYRGNLVSVGARKGGCEMTALDEYLSKHPNHLISPPVLDLSEEDMIEQEKYAEEVCFINKRKYQFLMFLAWDLKVRTFGLLSIGDWTDIKDYCFELALRFAAKAKRYDGGFDKLISIYEAWENKHFKHE